MRSSVSLLKHCFVKIVGFPTICSVGNVQVILVCSQFFNHYTLTDLRNIAKVCVCVCVCMCVGVCAYMCLCVCKRSNGRNQTPSIKCGIYMSGSPFNVILKGNKK